MARRVSNAAAVVAAMLRPVVGGIRNPVVQVAGWETEGRIQWEVDRRLPV